MDTLVHKIHTLVKGGGDPDKAAKAILAIIEVELDMQRRECAEVYQDWEGRQADSRLTKLILKAGTKDG